MKKNIFLPFFILTIMIIGIVGGAAVYSQENGNSKYNGKIVKKIQFAGVTTRNGMIIGENGEPITDSSPKKKIVPIQNISELELVNSCITEKGKPFSAENIAKDVKTLVDVANLSFCYVEVAEDGDGVALTFFIEELPLVESIEWRGLAEVRSVDLESQLTFEVDDPVREGEIQKSKNRIIAYFIGKGKNDVAVYYSVEPVEGKTSKKVIFTVDEGENKKVEQITILGTNKIPDYEILSVMELKASGIVNTGDMIYGTLEADLQKIIYYYKSKGYIDARIVDTDIDYYWEDPENKTVRKIYITIKVEEGERYFFGGYSVEIVKRDKKGLSPEKLKEVEKQEKTFKEEKLVEDELMKVLYQQKLFKSKTRKYKDKITSIYDDTIPDEMIFDGLMFEQDRAKLAMQYSGKGYIRTNIIPEKRIEEKEVTVNGKKVIRKYVFVNFKISPSEKAYVENIIIIGNTKTKEKVIRREVLIKEGEVFNSFKVELTRQKITNLGYFKFVNIDVRPGSASDKANLIIEVEEQSTGTVSLGGGYGTAAGFSIFADLSERNLFGNGQTIGTKIEYGPNKSSMTINFIEPWLFDYRVSLNTSIFYSRTTYNTISIFPSVDEYASYDKELFGYSIGLGYRFKYYYGTSLTWSHSFSRILNATGSSPDEIFLSQSKGFQETRTLSNLLYRDDRDNQMNPTKGTYLALTSQMTGGFLLRGERHFSKMIPEFEAFYSPFNLPLMDDHPVVFQFRMSADFILPPVGGSSVKNFQDPDTDPWIEADDRLNVGGPGTLRGWSYYDFDLPDSWRLGLFHRLLYGFEMRFPIVNKDMFWGALFFDAASLWSDRYWNDNIEDQSVITSDSDQKLLYDIRDLPEANLMEYFRYSYGFGVRVQIPMLPLRFWFGRKVVWKNGTGFKHISGYNFDFQIGDMRF